MIDTRETIGPAERRHCLVITAGRRQEGHQTMRLRIQDPRLLLVVSAALLGAAVALPLGAFAGHQFSDVPNTNPFHADIDALADAGVTTGCAAGKYCPKDVVTREQMAAFLNRLGALGPGKTPIVNADKVDGVDEVLAAGDIVVRQQGPWTELQTSVLTITNERLRTVLSAPGGGDIFVFMALDGPSSIGGRAYGLKAVQVCHGASAADVDVSATVVTHGLFASVTDVGDLTTRDLAAQGCYTVQDADPVATTGAAWLTLGLAYTEPADVSLYSVATTWTPLN